MVPLRTGSLHQKSDELTTPDPARDGTNWLVYCAANPVGRWDPSGCWSQEYDKYVLHGNTDNQYNGTVPNTPGNPAGSTSSTTSCSNGSSSSSTNVETPASTWNETIESDVKEALSGLLNFDLGIDSFKKAGYAWNNGQYIKALLDSANGFGEMALDLISSKKIIKSAVKSAEMIVGTLQSLSESATVVLGKYSGGVSGGYIQFANAVDGKCFQIPQTIYKVLDKLGVAKQLNEAWLEGVINSGAKILLNSDPYAALENKTSYGMEIEHLQEFFTFKETVVNGLKCWEAVKK